MGKGFAGNGTRENRTFKMICVMWKEILEAKYLDGYRILIKFNDGIRKVVDFTGIVHRYPVFKPLKDIALFKQFKVTDTLEWDNGNIDIAPEYLYENGVLA